MNFVSHQSDFLPRCVDAEDFVLKNLHAVALEAAKAPHNLLGLALSDHEKKKAGHEHMLRPPIDENDIVKMAERSGELRGRDDAAAAAAEDHYLFALAGHS
jgi:hypothetical protein